MTIDLTPEQLAALSLVGWWMACIDAGRELDGDERLADDTPLMHSVSHGASAIVTAGNLRALAAVDVSPKPGRFINEEVLDAINDWASAYPLDVFPEPDMAAVRAALEARGITIDCVSASNMRHVIRNVQLMLRTNTR